MTSTDDRSELNTPDEAPARRQYGQLVEVVLENGTPDPDVFTLHVANPDRIRYEKTAAKHPEWPPLAIGRNFAMTFVTWAAAQRAGKTGLTFPQWEAALLDYDAIEDVPADPTRPTPSPAATSS